MLTVRARERRTGRTVGQGRVPTRFMDPHLATGSTEDGSDQGTGTKKAPINSERQYHNKDNRMTHWISTDWGRDPFYGVLGGDSLPRTPPLEKNPKEGEIPPHPPSFRWVERARDLARRGSIKGKGHPRVIFTARIDECLWPSTHLYHPTKRVSSTLVAHVLVPVLRSPKG